MPNFCDHVMYKSVYVESGFDYIMTLLKEQHLTPRVTFNRREKVVVNENVRKLTLKKKKNQKPSQKLKYHLPFKKGFKPQGVDIFSYCCTCCHCTTLSIEKKNKSKKRPKFIDIKRKRIKAQLVTRNIFKKRKSKTTFDKNIGDHFSEQIE